MRPERFFFASLAALAYNRQYLKTSDFMPTLKQLARKNIDELLKRLAAHPRKPQLCIEPPPVERI
jgi:hypothetical protein